MSLTPYIVRREDTKTFYEGAEFCREYFRNDLLWFGSSLVNPGDTGAVDPGHAGAWEVFYGSSRISVGVIEHFQAVEAGSWR